MKNAGFTIIELMISSAILLIALASISIVYISAERLMYYGINQTDVQRKAQTVGERIVRWIRPARDVNIINGGNGIEIDIPIDVEDTITSGVYYEEESIYYDSNIEDNVPAIKITDWVYETDNPIFRKAGDLVYVNFGIENNYLHGPVNPVETELTIKIRNAD